MENNSGKQFEELINAHKGIIIKVAKMYAYTDAKQKDLFQEIVIQLWKAYPRFKGQSKWSTWIYRVALNTAISGLRKEKKEIIAFMPDLSFLDRTEINENEDKEQKLTLLYAAIRQLNQIDTAVVMLYLDDKGYDDMEEILGINQGNLRVRLSRIKDRLRQITKKDLYGTR